MNLLISGPPEFEKAFFLELCLPICDEDNLKTRTVGRVNYAMVSLYQNCRLSSNFGRNPSKGSWSVWSSVCMGIQAHVKRLRWPSGKASSSEPHCSRFET
ncbi:hypothetical protein AVEN_55213-1 [Araneus ventricosus]|uniref:Uncharacterized protein n=1 Tax=Araneus ventricosus TaxID=182803 RepID=A0A4Y2G8H1_ARAVE|nr:hypothetical protein AVEN_55213-1 [Araneus ventricosus]